MLCFFVKMIFVPPVVFFVVFFFLLYLFTSVHNAQMEQTVQKFVSIKFPSC